MRDEEQIVAIATRLFAELGYDSTDTGLIAEAAGIDGRTLAEATGGKRELYRTVMRQAFLAEEELLQRALAAYTPDVAGAHEVTEIYLDFYVANPQIVSLWMHRWMGDATDVADLEKEYVNPQADAIAAAIRDLTPPDVNVDFLVRTVIWCIFGFLSGGLPGRQGRAGQEPEPDEIAEFRVYLHVLIDRMFAPAP
ncbi:MULTISPECIES: TetR/AcrR family transcriptional regulator [Thermomonosporaceae]|uniref:TetR/AcrR family transcriptional regulator n=1 Tax=Thermomonosporaceae TaxID=2012 RepID=UPI00255B1C4A|nr:MULTISPECIES: TetR/AcrR family transcriptional regulator [Thermomonosporaceae]MDL4774345.1 TetR/AcrR family transcriptional regulator [Actinomadura xylanilytica]